MSRIKVTTDENYIGLFKRLPCGRIVQLGMTAEQQQMIQMTVGALSQDSPIALLPESYDLVLKAEAS